MAEVRVPFSATAELPPSFKLDETFAEPNGVKSILFDKSGLNVLARSEFVDIPNIGQVQIYVYYVVGDIQFRANAFPVVQSEVGDVMEQTSIFNDQEGNKAADQAATSANAAQGWISASASAAVDAPVGSASSIGDLPSVMSVTVENLAVANNLVSELAPEGEEQGKPKYIVKWRGDFVITTA